MIAPGTGPNPVRRLAGPTLFSAVLATLGLVAILAAQPAATVRSPYLDAVRGKGGERGRRSGARLTDPTGVLRRAAPRCTRGAAISADARAGRGPACAHTAPPTLFSADARHPGNRGRPGGTAVGRDPFAVPRRGAPLRPGDGAGGDRRAAGAAPARCRRGLRGARRQDLRRRRRARAVSRGSWSTRAGTRRGRSRPRGAGSTPGPWRSTSRRWRRAIPPPTSPPCGCT